MGNGFGGTLALAFAHQNPEALSRLILVDAAAGFPEAGKAAFRTMAKMVAADGMGAIATVAAKRVYHDRYVVDHPHVIDERRAVLLAVEPEAFRQACEVLVACDLVPALGEVQSSDADRLRRRGSGDSAGAQSRGRGGSAERDSARDSGLRALSASGTTRGLPGRRRNGHRRPGPLTGARQFRRGWLEVLSYQSKG